MTQQFVATPYNDKELKHFRQQAMKPYVARLVATIDAKEEELEEVRGKLLEATQDNESLAKHNAELLAAMSEQDREQAELERDYELTMKDATNRGGW